MQCMQQYLLGGLGSALLVVRSCKATEQIRHTLLKMHPCAHCTFLSLGHAQQGTCRFVDESEGNMHYRNLNVRLVSNLTLLRLYYKPHLALWLGRKQQRSARLVGIGKIWGRGA